MIYFAWEFDRQIKIDLKNSTNTVVILPGVEELKLLSESEGLPERQLNRADIHVEKFIEQDSAKFFSSSDDEYSEYSEQDSELELVTDIPELSAVSMDRQIVTTYCYEFGLITKEIMCCDLNI